jgi:hypothetical protein
MSSQKITITDIPSEKVDALVKDHRIMGADRIEIIKQSDERFSLAVTYLLGL